MTVAVVGVFILVAVVSYIAGHVDGYEEGYKNCLDYQQLFRR